LIVQQEDIAQLFQDSEMSDILSLVVGRGIREAVGVAEK
jgi:hypothetical protein